MGRAWLRIALTIPEIEIVALVDTDVARAEAFAKAFELEGIAVSPDLEGTLVRTTPDLLFDVTVPESHEAVVTAWRRRSGWWRRPSAPAAATG
jgi:predicted dehydrogenase